MSAQRAAWWLVSPALIALVVCLTLTALFLNNAFTFVPVLLSQLLGQGFSIVSWVVLWHPVEAFLYDPIPLKREISALRYIAALEMVIETQRGQNR